MDYIESLISRMKADAERDGKATISSDEIVILLECYNDHMGPHKRFAEDHIEPLLYRIKADAEPEGKATISADEVVTLLQWYNDHRGLKKRFAEVHFQLLDRVARENVAINILKGSKGTTHERRKWALEALGLEVSKKSPVDETFLLLYYSNMRNGVGPFDPEKKLEPLTEDEAITYISNLTRQPKKELIKELQGAYYLVVLYSSLRRGFDLFNREEENKKPNKHSDGEPSPDPLVDPLSAEDALSYMADLGQQTKEAVEKEIKRVYKRLKDAVDLPKGKAGKQLKKNIPSGRIKKK